MPVSITDSSTGGETARECSEAAKAEAGGKGGCEDMDGDWVGIMVGNVVGVVGATAGAGDIPSAEPGALIPSPFLSRQPASSGPVPPSSSTDRGLVLGRGKDGVSSSSLTMKTSRFSDLWRSLLSALSSESRPGSSGFAEDGWSSGSVMSGLYGLSRGHLFLTIILILSA